MKKFVSIFLAACALSTMSVTAFAQQAQAVNVTSDEQITQSRNHGGTGARFQFPAVGRPISDY